MLGLEPLVEFSRAPPFVMVPYDGRSRASGSRIAPLTKQSMECVAHEMCSVVKKTWSALSAEINELNVRSPFDFEYSTPDPLLTVVLEMVGGQMRKGLRRDTLRHQDEDAENAMLFAPSGTTIFMASDNACYVRSMEIRFDANAMARLFHEDSPPKLPLNARVNFFDREILGLVRLLEAECLTNAAVDVLYGDSLSISMISLLARADRKTVSCRQSGGLTARQLRLVTDYMESHFGETVTLSDLAELTRLSPSHFCKVFKATTGTPPHRWLNALRIAQAKRLLLRGESLAEIAVATGFTDQPHLTRIFARLTGLTPGVWRRQCLL
jgi:AraC family transcriptional regulator